MIVCGVDWGLNSNAIFWIDTDKSYGYFFAKAPEKFCRQDKEQIYRVQAFEDWFAKHIVLADFVAIEKPFLPKRTNVILSIGKMLWVMERSLIALGIPFIYVNPLTCRKNLLGNGSASKDDVVKFAIKRFPNINWQLPKSAVNHVADASLIAFYALKNKCRPFWGRHQKGASEGVEQ